MTQGLGREGKGQNYQILTHSELLFLGLLPGSITVSIISRRDDEINSPKYTEQCKYRKTKRNRNS